MKLGRPNLNLLSLSLPRRMAILVDDSSDEGSDDVRLSRLPRGVKRKALEPSDDEDLALSSKKKGPIEVDPARLFVNIPVSDSRFEPKVAFIGAGP